MIDQPWLSESEVWFHRMETFHRQRVEAITSGKSPLGNRTDGIFVLHLIPLACVQSRPRIDVAKLKEHGGQIPALGSSGGQSRFNVDGLLITDGRDVGRCYSQVFRDGRLEAAMGGAAYPAKGEQGTVKCLRDSLCEQSVFRTVAGYLRFCKTLEVNRPIQMFTALIGCEGVRICIDPTWGDASDHAIDRSPLHLPDVEIASLDGEQQQLLRSWCDTLWQAVGMERSFNFGEDGKWRERRR